MSIFDLAKYQGSWTEKEVSHLLRRTTFISNKVTIQEYVDLGFEATFNQLFAPKPDPELPVYFNFHDDPNAKNGDTWVNIPYSDVQGLLQARLRSINAWLVGQAVNQGVSIIEKMTLFWHGHFVTSDIVDANYVYRTNMLYRRYATGNFRELTKEVIIDPSMLRYLNGNQNSKQQPNENMARELLELFTIGKGPLAGPGDYTYYTEDDVAAIAKVLTGWRDSGFLNYRGKELAVQFDRFRHDPSTKFLSYRFNNAVIQNAWEDEYKNLVDIIFEQEAVAHFIVRQLYRWFIYYEIDEATEENIIRPLGKMLKDNDYEILSVLQTLLQSEHFFSDELRGVMIKNPLDLVLHMVSQFDISFPEKTDDRYFLWNRIAGASELMGMAYLKPPDVAGWKAYYQEPGYYRSWINSSLISLRSQVITLIVYQIEMNDLALYNDIITLVKQFEGIDDPNVLIDELSNYFFSKAISSKQKEYLKTVLLPGLPDYEWSIEWSTFLADENNPIVRAAIEIKLRAFINAMLLLPEYQLS